MIISGRSFEDPGAWSRRRSRTSIVEHDGERCLEDADSRFRMVLADCLEGPHFSYIGDQRR
jgi:hypothetical protein